MASSFSGSLLATLNASYQNSNALSTPADNPTISQKVTYANGSGPNQAGKISYGVLTFTAGQTQTLDLTAMLDPFGISFSFASTGVKGFIFINQTVVAGSLITVLPGASNGWIVTIAGVTYGPFSNANHRMSMGAGGKILSESPVDGFNGIDGTHKTIDIFSQLVSSVAYAIWG